MTELEKVEKLREKGNVSFADAKEALDNSNGDILSALIYLENAGKVKKPENSGFFSGADIPVQEKETSSKQKKKKDREDRSDETFGDLMKRFGDFCLKIFNKGLNNHLEASIGDKVLFACPVIIVILLAIIFSWFLLILFVISLFCGFRYRFTGDDLGKDSVNSVMDGATDVVEDVKASFTNSPGKKDSTYDDDDYDDD